MRCHKSSFGAAEFNPGKGRGRFHPLQNERGEIIPTLYGASTLDGALSESIFHNVPFRGTSRVIDVAALEPMQVSLLKPRRGLKLVQLHGYGLRRLGVKRSELIDSEASQYGRTAAWAVALHAWNGEVDGLIWVSRLYDTAFALVLFGDRVTRDDLEVIPSPLKLSSIRGLKEVRRAAEQAAILISE